MLSVLSGRGWPLRLTGISYTVDAEAKIDAGGCQMKENIRTGESQEPWTMAHK